MYRKVPDYQNGGYKRIRITDENSISGDSEGMELVDSPLTDQGKAEMINKQARRIKEAKRDE